MRTLFLVGAVLLSMSLTAQGADLAWDANFSGNWNDPNYWWIGASAAGRFPAGDANYSDRASIYTQAGNGVLIDTTQANYFKIDGNLGGYVAQPVTVQGQLTVASGGELVAVASSNATIYAIQNNIAKGFTGQLIVDGGIATGCTWMSGGSAQGGYLYLQGGGSTSSTPGIWLKSGQLGGNVPGLDPNKLSFDANLISYTQGMTFRGAYSIGGGQTYVARQDGGLWLGTMIIAYQGASGGDNTVYFYKNGGDTGIPNGTGNALSVSANRTGDTRVLAANGYWVQTDGNTYVSMNGNFALNYSGGYAELDVSGGYFQGYGSTVMLVRASSSDNGSRLARKGQITQSGGTVVWGTTWASSSGSLYISGNNPSGNFVGAGGYQDPNYVGADANYVITGGSMTIMTNPGSTSSGLYVGTGGTDPNFRALFWVGGNGPASIYSGGMVIVREFATMRFTLDANIGAFNGYGRYCTPIEANSRIFLAPNTYVDLWFDPGYDPVAEVAAMGLIEANIVYVLMHTAIAYGVDANSATNAALLVNGLSVAGDANWALGVGTMSDNTPNLYAEYHVVVPEPAALGVLGAGFAAILARRWRLRKKK